MTTIHQMPIRLFTCFTPNWCRKPNIIYILIFIDVKNIAVKTSICIRHTFSVPSMTGIVLHIFRVDHGNKSQRGSQQRPHSLFFRWTKVSRCSSNPLWNHLKSINQIKIFLPLWGWWHLVQKLLETWFDSKTFVLKTFALVSKPLSYTNKYKSTNHASRKDR